MTEKQQKLTAEEIVEKAFSFFETFVARSNQLEDVLLEELEPEGNGWIVSIGFNGTRQKTTEPANLGAMAALSGYGSKTITIVREVRRIYLDDEGNLIKIG